MKTSILAEEIADKILQGIQNGEYVYGDKLPAEEKLAELYSVSRATIRKAFTILNNYGYLKHIKNVGYTVKLPPVKEVPERETMFIDLVRDNKWETHSEIISMNIIAADEKLAKEFECQVGDKIQQIHKVRYVEGKPALDQYISLNTNSVIDFNPFLLQNDYFDDVIRRNYSIDITKIITNTTAVKASQFEIETLKIDKDMPILKTVLKGFNHLGNVVYCNTHYHLIPEIGYEGTWVSSK